MVFRLVLKILLISCNSIYNFLQNFNPTVCQLRGAFNFFLKNLGGVGV